ncbi:pyrroline-5-carboxylate reductase [Thermoflexales bacterium]|nr:pyrroline-5-carboxylate reductase [Thermoflexales bacterium]
MAHTSIGFIGGGRVTRIMLGGWQRQGHLPERIVVSDPNVENLAKLQADFPSIETALNDNRAAAAQDIVFIGLHPPAFAGALDEIKASLKPTALVVSLAPKVSIAKLSAALGTDKIARLIPNAPSIVNAGYNPVAFAAGLSAAGRAVLCEWLSILGDSPEVDEAKLEAYAILTAMGPTYLWFQLYELQAVSEAFGLTPQEVSIGLEAMVKGTVQTMTTAQLSSADVMDLIPVKPLGEDEAAIKGFYHTRLEALYAKLKS